MIWKERRLCACGCQREVKRPTGIYFSKHCRAKPRAICACGCGRPVKRWYNEFYETACRWRHLPTRKLCVCGCKRRVKKYQHKYFSPECIDTRARAEIARKGGVIAAHLLRHRKFGLELGRLERTVTREDLYVVFQRIYERGYSAGYNSKRLGFKKAIQDVA